ncbi:FAD-dependent monooxygenase [Kitasatospora sp. LaBMicrA B282]|uniref:FAD-dependent monooxygenase n=1 Tax=Kitasatospora sp. LaBMicrA B282 TaxID=3420949 RepID=UPI003D103FCA
MGGSIAGCAGALAVARAGAGEVVVFERAASQLEERGVGLAMHNDRYAELAEAGFVDAGMPFVQLATRPWVVRDGDEPAGRTVAVLPMPFRSYSWGPLWRALRSRIPAGVDYRSGVSVAAVERSGDGALVRLADGTEDHFDLVLGADGYRSLVRAATFPAEAASYGGHLAWRGTLPVERLPEPRDAFPSHAAATVAFPGGHMISYWIPGHDGGGAMVNWVLYAVPPGPAERFADPGGTHPRVVDEDLMLHQQELVARHFPPFWQEVVARTAPADRFIQPMYDMAIPHYADGPFALLGDAASIARPPTGSGAVKALQDAAALERALTGAETLAQGLRAYSEDRAPVGHATVRLGRSLGRALVEQTPDWSAMDSAALEEWWLQAGGGNGFGGLKLRR